MTYEQFKKECMERIKDYLPDSYKTATVSIDSRIKNNDTELDALIIRKKDSNMAPAIYINDLYEEYRRGSSFDDILRQVAKTRIEAEMLLLKTQQINEFVEKFTEYDSIKDKIVAKLVGVANNQELLRNRPHYIKEDLAITYHIIIQENEDRTLSIPIDNALFDKYPVNIIELHDQALNNTFENSRAQIINLQELFGVSDRNAVPMYVVTNEYQRDGAIHIFNEKLMDKLTEKIQGDLYVLPASVNEVIVVPKSSIGNINQMEKLVRMVNRTSVTPEDFLSNNVYEYSNKELALVKYDNKRRKGRER